LVDETSLKVSLKEAKEDGNLSEDQQKYYDQEVTIVFPEER